MARGTTEEHSTHTHTHTHFMDHAHARHAGKSVCNKLRSAHVHDGRAHPCRPQQSPHDHHRLQLRSGQPCSRSLSERTWKRKSVQSDSKTHTQKSSRTRKDMRRPAMQSTRAGHRSHVRTRMRLRARPCACAAHRQTVREPHLVIDYHDHTRTQTRQLSCSDGRAQHINRTVRGEVTEATDGACIHAHTQTMTMYASDRTQVGFLCLLRVWQLCAQIERVSWCSHVSRAFCVYMRLMCASAPHVWDHTSDAAT